MKKRFSFDSRIIEHMGKDLITVPEVAVIELIKNAIDAKSKEINFKIYSEMKENSVIFDKIRISDVSDLLTSSIGLPFILLEDFGKGMNEETLDEGFLKVGTKIKLQEDDVLFGQKGIGRLAAQRLGKKLIVETTQSEETEVNIVVIDWDEVSNKNIDNIEVPFFKSPKSDFKKSYTRLWILDAEIDDIIYRPGQQNLFEDEMIELKEEVSSAITFLITPYIENQNAKINVFYNDIRLPSSFNRKFLEVAESVHAFKLDKAEDGSIHLEMDMKLRPFYLEKVHKTRLGSEVDFSLYKLKAEQYAKLYEKYKDRYNATLVKELDERELIEYFEDKLQKIYRNKVSKEKKIKYQEYIHSIAQRQVYNLKKISPITGEIFSFKRDNIVGALYINYLKEINNENFEDLTVRDVQRFLKNYNGVKLYRNLYRIGFLGNKDNDWIEMQQYRTMGQQFYRFNLGDTLGYVSINDPEQKHIKEISSRLDIYSDDTSRTFKDFINYIFNEFFYNFNRSADEITRNILKEEGLIENSISEKIKKSNDITKDLIKKNQKLLKKVLETKKLLNQNVSFENDKAVIPNEVFNSTVETLCEIEDNTADTNNIIQDSQKVLSESHERLKQIEIESFNNFKLMANGLITESITHELHSVVMDSGVEYLENNWTSIEKELIKNSVVTYNDHYIPVKESYDTVMNKIDDIGNLYNLLESTFVKGDNKTDYDLENLGETIHKIEKNLIKDLKKSKITIIYDTMNFVQSLPKGVMLHVFYNLITNSKYWIDYRRKHAKQDKSYEYTGEDYIKIECLSKGIIEVTDSGTGVLQNMEHILFGALQSGKEANKGRGMGLYIVKRFLNSFGAEIILSEERNQYGNRYKFVISLPE